MGHSTIHLQILTFSPDHSKAHFVMASVTVLLVFALTMAKKVTTLIDEFGDAPSEIEDLGGQIKSLRAVLESDQTLSDL